MSVYSSACLYLYLIFTLTQVIVQAVAEEMTSGRYICCFSSRDNNVHTCEFDLCLLASNVSVWLPPNFLCLDVHRSTSKGVPGPLMALDSATPTSHHEKMYNRRTVWVKASSLLAPPGVTSRRHVLTEVMGGLGWDYCFVFRGDSLGCRLWGH